MADLKNITAGCLAVLPLIFLPSLAIAAMLLLVRHKTARLPRPGQSLFNSTTVPFLATLYAFFPGFSMATLRGNFLSAKGLVSTGAATPLNTYALRGRATQ